MKHLERLSRKHLGEILVDEGLISKNQLVDAEREVHTTGESLGPVLVEANYITDWDLAKTVSSQYQLPFVQLNTIAQTKSVQGIFLPEEQQKHRFYPLDRVGNVLTLAVADMPNIEFLRGIQERTGLTPFLFVALLSEIQQTLIDETAVPEAAAPAPEAEAEADSETIPEITAPDEAVPAEINEEDWQQGLSIFDQAMEEDDAAAEAPAAPAPESAEPAAKEEGADWHNIFDVANDSVMKEIDRE